MGMDDPLNEDPNHDYGLWLDDYHQLDYAPRWLTRIGSQIMFLRNVIIDSDVMFSERYSYNLECMDILPLLLVMWEHPSIQCSITLGRTGRTLQCSFAPITPTTSLC